MVRAYHAAILPAPRIPYLIFEYVPGRDVAYLAQEGLLSPADVRRLGIDAARGLAHIHRHGVYHCDIKPGNLLWTDEGTKIIDFNVAVGLDQSLGNAGSSRYLPPDYPGGPHPAGPNLVDRDTYALGLSLYEALTRGNWPWEERRKAPPGAPPRHLTSFTDLADLAPEFADVLLRAIQPNRADRYEDASELLSALERVPDVRRRPPPPLIKPGQDRPPGRATNDNPFIAHLQTLYSQSSTSNRGTRGLDPHEFEVYVPTLLDHKLIPDVLNGQHCLVIITGNAGDGKTAFLERLVQVAVRKGAVVGPSRSNGADFTLAGRQFRTNLDGSQDEGGRANDDVLADFFAPYAGATTADWPQRETRLIAINEGRLVDFLRMGSAEYPALAAAARASLDGAGGSQSGVTLVNLNSRSVVAAAIGVEVESGADAEESIFDRMLGRMTSDRFWADCSGCSLADRCYALHNARTFAHPDAGPRVTERLRTLFTLTHLRGKLHITLRDLRSALAYLLTSGRDCGQIRDLYAQGEPAEILSGFYFLSWAGPVSTHDRLLRLLRQGMIGEGADPSLDRRLDFVGPGEGSAFMAIDGRGEYDRELLEALFRKLPRGGDVNAERLDAHRDYVTAARHRFFFESQDDQRWRTLLSTRTPGRSPGCPSSASRSWPRTPTGTPPASIRPKARRPRSRPPSRWPGPRRRATAPNCGNCSKPTGMKGGTTSGSRRWMPTGCRWRLAAGPTLIGTVRAMRATGSTSFPMESTTVQSTTGSGERSASPKRAGISSSRQLPRAGHSNRFVTRRHVGRILPRGRTRRLPSARSWLTSDRKASSTSRSRRTWPILRRGSCSNRLALAAGTFR